MTVAAILQTKGDRVVAVQPGESLATVCAVLTREGIGAAVVREGAGRVVGVISERDIVRGIAAHGSGILASPVERLMTRDVLYCAPQDSIGNVMQMMTSRRVRHLPVLNGGRLIGIVSIGDVVKWRIAETEQEAEALRQYIATG